LRAHFLILYLAGSQKPRESIKKENPK
jgi:hypothetical protein